LANSHSSPTGKATEPATGNSGHEVLRRELASLRRSEAVLRDFIETSTIGLHWVGADGAILWVNQAELDLLGYSREEYVGRNIAEFHADESVIDDILGRLSRGETLRVSGCSGEPFSLLNRPLLPARRNLCCGARGMSSTPQLCGLGSPLLLLALHERRV
jgi:hypothetical protein